MERKPIQNIMVKVTAIAGALFSMSPAIAQCLSSGTFTVLGMGGGDTNPHPFENRCLAQTGTNVTITIEAMADLGCYAWDAVHDPPPNQCPSCGNIPCCDTAPSAKYVTVTGNGNLLSPSIPGSANMPANGYFFQDWNTDCYTSSQGCLEAGRSPCDPSNPAPNRRVVTIPAETWNAWLGLSGNTVTIRVTSTAATSSTLAGYCYNLGFQNCPGQGQCSGPCGPDTLSRVSIAYTAEPECQDNGDCDDEDNVCTFDQCNDDLCSNMPARYCDAAGSGGSCGPDGQITLEDITAVLDAFAGQYATGCAPHNFDVAKDNAVPGDPTTGCGADGIIDLLEILAVLDAFAGIDPCDCGGGGGGGSPPPSPPPPAPPCPPGGGDSIVILDPTPLYGMSQGQPPIAYLVDVHVYGFDSLRGYQVGLEAAGPNAEHIQLTDLTVEHTKPTYAFVKTPADERVDAIDLANGRVAGALHQGGVAVRSYLATYRFEPVAGAPSPFTVAVQTTSATAIYNSDGCQDEPETYSIDLDF